MAIIVTAENLESFVDFALRRQQKFAFAINTFATTTTKLENK